MTLLEQNHDNKALVIDEDAPFSIDELFFARTDKRGAIQAGNSVFQRVSEYSWDQLSNAPHQITRHPDMPKAVFWLLWEKLKKGEPTGAFIKNRAQDGRHYWAFAIITPVDDGYLSVNLKPSGDLFETIKREYQTLLNTERDQNLSPEDSGKLFLEHLNELGYRDYEAFQAAAIAQEITTRNEQLGRRSDTSIDHFNRLEKSSQSLIDRTAAIFKVYMGSEYVPLNLRVQATQLGAIGAPMCIISNNYTSISSELQTNMEMFIEAGKQVTNSIDEGLFLMGASKIQKEAAQVFELEISKQEVPHAQELALLNNQSSAYSVKAAIGLKDISIQINQFSHACMAMKRLTTSLEVTRIMGKIESASLGSTINTLDDLIDDLGSFQKALMDGLKDIDQANRAMECDIRDLLKAS